MSSYTISRYDFNIAGGVAHAFWVLEEINPDGSTKERLAAIHGMATDSSGKPMEIGNPLDGSDHIKAHVYTRQPVESLGLKSPGNVRQQRYDPRGQDVGADFLATGSPRRSTLGPMSKADAVAKFQGALDAAAAINDKKQGYSIAGTNSNTVAKHIAEIFGDASLKQIDGNGRNEKEHNKPGWSQRILSPEEIRKVNPDSHTVSYPRPDAGEYSPVIIAVDEPGEIWEGRQGGIVTRTPKARPTVPGPAPTPLRMPSLLGDFMQTDVSR